MSEITITPAEDHEAGACLALLPQARDFPVELLIARRGGEVVGAAALSWRNWAEPVGFPTLIHVVPAARRRGVGTRLLHAAADLAAEETDGLWTFAKVAETGPAAAFLRAAGFAVGRRHHHFEADIAALFADVAPKAERLRRRGRVPEDMVVTPLSAAPLGEIGWLVAIELGGAPEQALRRLERRVRNASAVSGDRSLALISDGEVVAVMLWRIEDGVALIDGRVVHPAHRGGWPNAILLEASLNRIRDEGVTRFRFDCDDTVRDTLSLARRCAATETERTASWYYAFAEAGETV
jgi:GNAT superfamily N-acetyltransferase